jgi:predicted Rossmann fold flavoprotein
MKKVAIIGGGAAGMMAAATLLESGVPAEIHLFEKNASLGKKVIISGGGRCNVTTGLTDMKKLLTKYTRGASFLRAALAAFPPERVRQWFEDHGTPLKCEEDLRVFPVSDRGEDVVGVFERLFEKGGVHLRLATSVKEIKPEGDEFGLTTAAGLEKFDAVVITSGGNAYRHTGSTGDGYDFAKACGHTITALGPSLNSFEVLEEWPKSLSGLSFEKSALVWSAIQVPGPFLFTHFGISGPVTFALSSHMAFETISKAQPVQVRFRPEADLGAADWDAKLKTVFSASGAKQLHNVLSQFFPDRFAQALLGLASLDGTKKAAELSKEHRQSLARLLGDGIPVTLVLRRPGDEFVTAGGVSTEEIDPKTMRSKINPNLYFAGEVMDVDGVTGGFNLQCAWATGKMAGASVAKTLI